MEYWWVVIVCLVLVAAVVNLVRRRKKKIQKKKQETEPVFGLNTTNELGQRVIDSGTFTIRLVTSMRLSLGAMAAGRSVQISVPGARNGMFAQVTPLRQIPRNQVLGITSEGGKTPYADHIPAVPTVTVGTNIITVTASSLPGLGGTDGNCAVYILSR